MMVVVFALTTATLFGCADFLGGYASKKSSAFAVTANAHLLGVLIFAAVLLVFPAAHPTEDLVFGAIAGVCGGIGVVSLYAALAQGRMSVLAPITAAVSGTVPALFDLSRGTRVGSIALAGLALALVAVITATSSKAEEDRAEIPLQSMALALLAGVGFAGSFISLSFTSQASGIWPIFAARAVSAGLLGAIALGRGIGFSLDAESRGPTFSAGLFDAFANVTMLAAIRTGPLVVASVLGSLYPVVTIVLARAVLGERLRGMQRAGVALALVAVMLSSMR